MDVGIPPHQAPNGRKSGLVTKRWLTVLAAMAAMVSPGSATPVDVLPVRDPARVQTLNGTWSFRYEAGPPSETANRFHAVDMHPDGWSELAVPANWEMHGFAEPRYAHIEPGNGYYRRRFRVPPTWQGQRVMLRFEGAMYGLEAWVNGRRIGEWNSGYNPVAFDITESLHRDADNLLAVRVSTAVKGADFDLNDCWSLAGLYRDVTLWAVPQTYLEHYTARTSLQPDGTARVHLDVTTAGQTRDGTVRIRLAGADGAVVQDVELPVRDGRAAGVLEVKQPRLWTAETPALYALTLELAAGGAVQSVTERIGLREVRVTDGVLTLNGRPIKLRGVNHHDIWPREGRVSTEEGLRRDLELIRAANCNFVRTSHYPPHPRLIELCDELGLYVMDEVPFGFGDSHLNDPSYQGILLERARATVRRDENRPSVIIWSVGNENPNTPLTFATGKRVKELDPSRPICFPQIGDYFAGSYPELPDWVDIYAPHYPDLKTVKRYAETLKRPVILTEYAHALGLTGELVQTEWPVMQTSPHFAGGAVWMFQDQGILRRRDAITYDEAARLAVLLDSEHAYDTNADQGMDGIVYSDRVPQPDYWLLRKVYSPVQIPLGVLTVKPGRQQVSIPVENRFDFRSLHGDVLTWQVRRNAAVIASGRVGLDAPAGGKQSIDLSLDVPEDAGDDLLALELRWQPGAAGSGYERVIPLRVDGRRSVAAAALAGLRPGAVTMTDSENTVTVQFANGSLVADRKSGIITLRNAKGVNVGSGPWVHAGRRFTRGEEMRQKREFPWPGSYFDKAEEIAVRHEQTPQGGAAVTVRGRYARPGDAAQSVEGWHRVEVRPNGSLEVTYDYGFVNARGLVLEAGVSFLTPPGATELRWIGGGPHQSYPDKDALNEFGSFQLARDDLNFGGNRRGIDLALLAAGTGDGIALVGEGMDVAVERIAEETLLSHNAVVSGRGGKFAGSERAVLAETKPEVKGRFHVMLLDSAWPQPLPRWLGEPTRTVEPFRPYHRSYDQ